MSAHGYNGQYRKLYEIGWFGIDTTPLFSWSIYQLHELEKTVLKHDIL